MQRLEQVIAIEILKKIFTAEIAKGQLNLSEVERASFAFAVRLRIVCKIVEKMQDFAFTAFLLGV